MASQAAYVPVGQSRKLLESSPSTNQRHPSTNPSSTQRDCWTSWMNNGWLVEAASTALGILFVVTLVIVLHVYDGRPAPQFGSAFGSSLTLNTITAILSAVAKAALLHPVAECISQLKWIWFSKDYRQLSDMSAFDQASRGVSGGFGLLWATKLRTFAALGSLLMVYEIAIDPLSQQLVSYASVPVATSLNSTSQATAPIATTWNEILIGGQGGMVIMGTSENDYGYSDISTGMKGVILSGIYSGNETVEHIAPSCPSLNCTFPTYSSLAVCTSFANVSSHLVKQNISKSNFDYQLRYALSNTSYVNAGLGFFNASSASSPDDIQIGSSSLNLLNFNNSIAFKDVTLPLADVFVIYGKDIEGQYTRPDGVIEAGHLTYGAVEFIMEWCVQDFTTEVVNGSAVTTRHKATRNFRNPPFPTIDVDGVTYPISPDTHTSASRFLDRILRGSVQEGLDQYWYASSDIAQALFEPYNVWQAHPTDEVFTLSQGIKGTNQTGLELIINNIANGMTNFIRAYPDNVAEGTMFTQQIVVRVRWKWITAHVVFIALCVLLLMSTIITTHLSVLKNLVWKSSSSAVLHALSPSLQQEVRGIMTESELKIADQEQLVRLCNLESDGWRLLAHDSS